MLGQNFVSMLATKLRVSGPQHNKYFTIIAEASDRQAVIAIDPALTEELLINILKGFQEHTDQAFITPGVSSVSLEDVTVQQIVIGIGETGEPILCLAIGALRLNFRLPALGMLRQLIENANGILSLNNADFI